MLTATLRGRLILLVCLATLPTLLFILFIADQERSQALRRSEQESEYLVRLISREHFYQLSGAKGLLRWITDQMQKGHNIKMFRDTELLETLLAGYPQLSNIAVLSPSGEVLASAHHISSGCKMAGFDAIRRALNSTEIETGLYVIGPIVNRPVLHLAKSVTDLSGKVSYVVFVAIDLNWLNSLLEKSDLPAGHVLLLIDRNGTVLANSDSSEEVAYPVGTRISQLSELAVTNGLRKEFPVRMFPFVADPLNDVPGVFIASVFPYQRIQNEANAAFYKTISLLSMATICTAVCVVLLEEATILRWLRMLSQVSRKFGQGDYSIRVPEHAGDAELENVAKGFNSMAEALGRRHMELKDAHDRLNKLAKHLQIIRESEARRIARDLHDEVGQVLTSIKIDLVHLNSKCDTSCGNSIESNIDKIREKLDLLVDHVRGIASNLRPAVLDRMGLVAALELLARKIEENSQLLIDIESQEVIESLDWLIAITLYRIAQESLTNVLRHAMASHVCVTIRQTNSEIILTVEDNGKGFSDTNRSNETFGLVGMQERAGLVNGIFVLNSTPGKGTKISVTIPNDLQGGVSSNAYPFS